MKWLTITLIGVAIIAAHFLGYFAGLDADKAHVLELMDRGPILHSDGNNPVFEGVEAIEVDFVSYEERLEQRVSALEDKVEECWWLIDFLLTEDSVEYQADRSLSATGQYRLRVTRSDSDYVVVLLQSDDIDHIQVSSTDLGDVFIYYITSGDLCGFYLSADNSDRWDTASAWTHHTNIDGGQQ